MENTKPGKEVPDRRGNYDISEMNAARRVQYEGYLERNETVHVPITCLRAFDKIFIHRMKEEMQTLAGRRKYTIEYQDQWMCLTHYPDVEIAESFWQAKTERNCCGILRCILRNLKMQIFMVLKAVIHTYEGEMRKEKLLALRRFYRFCVNHQVTDIETMTLSEEQQFEQELAEEFKGRKETCCIWHPANE